MIPEMMKAVVTIGNGKFELRNVPVPTPKPDEILVKVEACAQNHTDWKSIILHKQAGNIVGSDFAGTVAVIGSAVPVGMRNLGERVAGAIRGNINPNGAFAEYLLANAALVFKLPDEVPFEVGTQLGVSCIAACSSSTGQYTVQFAKLSGLRVISTSSPQNFDFVRSLGAVEVYDYADSRTPKKVFAATSGGLKHAVDCISDGMTPVQVSGSLSKEGGTIVTVLPYESRKKGVKTELIMVYSMWGEAIEIPVALEANPAYFENGVQYNKMISHMLAEGMLKLGPIKLFPLGLASVEEGISYMMAGKTHAEKIVYKIADTPEIL